MLFIRTIIYFFFNDTPTTEIYTLSLHDALPISCSRSARVASSGVARRTMRRSGEGEGEGAGGDAAAAARLQPLQPRRDRKSTRLNSSHGYISYAVFCLKKKKKEKIIRNEH